MKLDSTNRKILLEEASHLTGGQEKVVCKLVPPHGGVLNALLVKNEQQRKENIQQAKSFAKVLLTSKEVSDVIMLATGAFSPLKGFMNRNDYETVVREMRLANGILWPIPVTVAISKEIAHNIKEGKKIALVDPERDEIMASMIIQEKFTYSKTEEVRRVFGTHDKAHPGVKKIYDQGEIYIGGPVEVFSEGEYAEKYPEYARPADTRAIFAEKGWKTVAAFQTRNPIHRSHEYLTKAAMEICDGLFIHPIVGKLKEDDIPAEVRLKCYKVLLEKYYPKDRVLLKVCPIEMRYGGPREALLHAIIRQNFGCSHMIVGRDHAGVGNYYGPFDAQDIFDELKPNDLHLKPIKMDRSFWCYKCKQVVTRKMCPHTDKDHLVISGTDLRAMLSRNEMPPKEFGRPEVIDILIDYYSRQAKRFNY